MDYELDVNRREEKLFLELFYRVLILMNEEHATEEEINNGIKKIVESFRGGPRGTCEVDNFPTFVDELGYFYYTSPVSSCVTRKKTLAAIKNCEEFLSFFHLPSLRVISVGAGVGSDLVGLYSAIYEYSQQSVEPQSIFQSMEILLIDNNIIWEPYFIKVDELLRDPDTDFGNAGHLMRSRSITTSFVQADLKEMSADLCQELGNTHIVWMKGVLSVQKRHADRIRIIENVVSSMSPGALLVVIDTPFFRNLVIENPKLTEIFDPIQENIYILVRFPEFDIRPRHCISTQEKMSIFKRI